MARGRRAQGPASQGASGLLPLVLEQLRDHALVLLDADGRIAGWLCGAKDIFGYSAEEVIGQPLDLLFLPEDRARAIPAHELEVAARDGRAEDDRWHVRKDGTQIWVTGTVSPLRDEAGRLEGFVKAMRDRTDIKGQIDALENHVEALATSNERKRIFLGTLAHELRNLLAPLVNGIQLVRLTVTDREDLNSPLCLIERQAGYMTRLVDDLTDMARVGAGKIQLEFRAVDLAAIIDDAVESCRSHIDERQHTLDVILPLARIRLEGDAERLHQVLVNLISNACKYTKPGGRIWLKGTVEGDEAIVRVEDTGVGIPPEELPHIFELFTQVETPPRASLGGLGIGLALVKELVAMHHGLVQVRSEGPGKGSEFTVRLPLRQPRPVGQQRSSDTPENP